MMDTDTACTRQQVMLCAKYSGDTTFSEERQSEGARRRERKRERETDRKEEEEEGEEEVEEELLVSPWPTRRTHHPQWGHRR